MTSGVTPSSQPAPSPGAGGGAGGHRALTSQDRKWADDALRLEREGLPAVRAVADKWRVGLTALTGVVATVLAVTGPFVGSAVADNTVRIAIGVFALLAIGALTVGTWNAMKAAFGVPHQSTTSGVELREWSLGEAAAAAGQLGKARRWTVKGFVFLVVVAGVGIFGTAPPKVTDLVTFAGDVSFCGELTYGNNGKTAIVTGSDGSVHAGPVSDLESIETDSTC